MPSTSTSQSTSVCARSCICVSVFLCVNKHERVMTAFLLHPSYCSHSLPITHIPFLHHTSTAFLSLTYAKTDMLEHANEYAYSYITNPKPWPAVQLFRRVQVPIADPASRQCLRRSGPILLLHKHTHTHVRQTHTALGLGFRLGILATKSLGFGFRIEGFETVFRVFRLRV